jgi:hypothetical protein
MKVKYQLAIEMKKKPNRLETRMESLESVPISSVDNWAPKPTVEIVFVHVLRLGDLLPQVDVIGLIVIATTE